VAIPESNDFVAFEVLVSNESEIVAPFLCRSRRPVPMNDADIEIFLLVKEHHRPRQDGIKAPLGFITSKGSVNAGVVDFWSPRFIEDNTSGGSYGYQMSKVASPVAGKSLAYGLKGRGIAVAILHPGLVQTRMTGFTTNGITPEVSVQGLLQRIDAMTLKNTGTFWHANGEVLPW